MMIIKITELVIVHLVLLKMILMIKKKKKKNMLLKLLYESEEQFDASKEFNVDMKEDVIEKENIDVSGCKDDVLKKKDYDGDDGNDKNSVRKNCNMSDDKVNVGMCGSGLVGISDNNASIDASGGTHDVRDELVVDSVNVSGTVNLNSSANTPVYSKRVIKSNFVFKSPFFIEFGSSEGEKYWKKPKLVMREICPFNDELSTFSDFSKQVEFNLWLDAGMKMKNK
ncbi:conserved hypothetical protein [Ricinus communis]|uniref:Uncharacterized protein n=1 Tax=Ricinus communis TaxID=3988 RepID=B9SCG1_RICCO|nr:conserved hypothetical protein [Ricinus communis]